jgi:hypothetical protein
MPVPKAAPFLMTTLALTAFINTPALHSQQDTAAVRPADCPDGTRRNIRILEREPHPEREYILPTNGAPRHARYKVTVLVRTDGTADSARTEVEPALPAGYAKTFWKNLRGWRWRPALKGGCPIEGTFTYSLEFS